MLGSWKRKKSVYEECYWYSDYAGRFCRDVHCTNTELLRDLYLPLNYYFINVDKTSIENIYNCYIGMFGNIIPF